MTDNIFQRDKESILNTYTRLPLEVVRAEGCYVWDSEGTRYLDLLGGIAVNVLGHSHPKVISAIEEQIKKYMHVSNFFYQKPQVELAEKLLELTGLSKVFFGNSGAETTEGSLKLARKWGAEHQKHKIISFKGGFHGRTYGALSLMDKPLYKDNMGPFLAGIEIIEYNDTDALQNNIDANTAAVFIEVIQGEGGLKYISEEFCATLMELKNKYDFLICVDEVQSGIWRTGEFCAYQNYDMDVDIVWLAKGLGGGLPLGAIITSERLDNTFLSGQHGTTFGGNAVSCAAGLAQLNEIDETFQNDIKKNSKFLEEGLHTLREKYPNYIDSVVGMGYMIGLDLTFEAKKLRDLLFDQHIITNSTSGNILRLVPPLILTKAELQYFLEELDKAFERYAELLP